MPTVAKQPNPGGRGAWPSSWGHCRSRAAATEAKLSSFNPKGREPTGKWGAWPRPGRPNGRRKKRGRGTSAIKRLDLSDSSIVVAGLFMPACHAASPCSREPGRGSRQSAQAGRRAEAVLLGQGRQVVRYSGLVRSLLAIREAEPLSAGRAQGVGFSLTASRPAGCQRLAAAVRAPPGCFA